MEEKSRRSPGILRVRKNSESRTTLLSSWTAWAVGTAEDSPSRASETCGHSLAAKHRGTTLSGASSGRPLTTRILLSPPIPEVAISAARTLVRIPPITAPSGSSLGFPFLRIPMSVVVPPMSMTMASLLPDSTMAPIMLAAGPESMVSTGRRRASLSPIIEPSPRTTISGALTPYSARTALTESISSWMTGMSLAFITHVAALSLKPRPEERSWPQTAGTSSISAAMSRTRFSWSGLRTERYPATATPSTLPRTDSRKALTASSSSGAASSPCRLWPPATCTEKSAGSEPLYGKPMHTRATLAPFPSTTELVARVDDRETIPTPPSSPLSMPSMAPRIPLLRSSRVVGDLALQRTLDSSRSIITASVYVPPVSSPSPVLIVSAPSVVRPGPARGRRARP